MNKLLFVFIILLLIALLLFSTKVNLFQKTEGYTNYNLEGATGNYPDAENNILVQDFYPRKDNVVSENNNQNIWWHYPTFKLGSYDQITNNIRYSNNPDIGKCTPSEFCGVLYKDNQEKTNYVKPLPPVDVNCGTRIGYFATDINMLPFRSET